jgi:hypothetical protein
MKRGLDAAFGRQGQSRDDIDEHPGVRSSELHLDRLQQGVRDLGQDLLDRCLPHLPEHLLHLRLVRRTLWILGHS